MLLLRAVLLDPEEARRSWERWRAGRTLEAADLASIRLFPLVYRNLTESGLDEADLNTLKGTYRAVWVRNHVLFERAAAGLRSLHEAGVRTLLLKGAALTVAHYRDEGVRPMDDVDVLVPSRDAEHALAALSAAGWTADAAVPPQVRAVLLHDEAGSLDLTWSLDDAFWQASVEAELQGVPTRVLGAADQLLHVAAQGGRWSLVPQVRWLADAATIHRSAGSELDWERLVGEATRRRMTALLTAALEHLEAAVDISAPQWVLERLRSAPKAPLERWAQRAATRPPSVGGRLPVALDRYRRLSAFDPTLRPIDFLKSHFVRNR